MQNSPLKNEKGFVLILALVTMVAMTVIGISLIMNITTDMSLSRNERDAKAAFQLAEAGIHEAIARLRLAETHSEYIGEETTDANYRTASWNSDDSKNFGYNFASADRQSADNLNYTVSVRYLTENNNESFCDNNDNVSPNNSGNAVSPADPNAASFCAGTAEVVMYGRDFNIPSTLTNIKYGKLPVYKITSTGTHSNTTRQIEVYVGASSLNTDTEYGLNTNDCINVAGGASNVGQVFQGDGCGCDADLTGGCAANKTAAQEASDYDMTTYLGDDIASIIDMADERHQCLNGNCSSVGDDIPSSGFIDDVVSDWGDFAANGHSTMIYINNAGGNDAKISGNHTGRGILIVTGNLDLTGGLQYEGLIYVFGTLRIGGGGSGLNVTGGVMANSTININGNITVVYDQPTLRDVARQNSSAATILWKRF